MFSHISHHLKVDNMSLLLQQLLFSYTTMATTPYRVYHAAFPFTARDVSELTMSPGDILIVYMGQDYQWQDDTRWMRGTATSSLS